jgi:hypothetical protein
MGLLYLYPLKYLIFCDMNVFLFPYETLGCELYSKLNAWLRKQNVLNTKPPDLHPHSQVELNQSTHNLQPANSYKCTKLTPKTASVVPPEDGRLTPETCKGLRHNNVIMKVKIY